MRGLWPCSMIIVVLLWHLPPAHGWQPARGLQPPFGSTANTAMGSRQAVHLASLENTRHYISYGTSSLATGGRSSRVQKGGEAPAIQNKKGYIEYQSEPSRDQFNQLQELQQEDRAASWRMLQNLIIGLPTESKAEGTARSQTPPAGK